MIEQEESLEENQGIGPGVGLVHLSFPTFTQFKNHDDRKVATSPRMRENIYMYGRSFSLSQI